MHYKHLHRVVLLCTLLILGLYSQAQDRVVTGRVADSTNTPIEGVSVSVKGGRGGVQTNRDGAFSISVPSGNGTLIFSSVGFTSVEMPVSEGSMNITMSGTPSSLTEVVVIGYGTTRKKDATGSIATVTAKDFQKGNITTPEQLIAGKVAGVSIISNGGQPGQGSVIRIRGGSSLNASNDPLIVIDGVPLDNGTISGGNNPLSFINPNDVESFTILKDASAAAIYGTRASNGVIIITTKKGRSDKLRVNFSSVNSAAKVTKTVDVLSADQVRSIVNEKGTPAKKALLGSANTDWQNEIYQTALASDNNLSITGGVKNFPYRLSLGYLNQEGVLRTDHLEKNSAAFVLNPTLFDNHLKIDLNLKGSIQKYRFANQGAIGSAVYFDPTQPVYNNNKRFGGLFEWLDASGNPDRMTGRNPVGQLLDRNDNSNAKRSIGNAQFDYKFHFLPDLHANLNLGYDVSKGTGTIFVSDSSAIGFLGRGENNHYKQTKQNTVLEAYLNYAKDFESIKSRIDVLAGYSYNNYQTKNYFYAGYYANGDKVPGTDPNFAFDIPENTLISYFGRLNYTLNNKYLLTATVRRDGSSRFGPNDRWGVFPAFALAWKIKDENFLKDNTVFSDLKVRAGYGITGQQDGIGNYNYLSVYGLSNTFASYPFGVTYYQMFRPSGYNSGIKWEQTATTNLAVDYGFMNNRINGSIDFYYKKTKDLLNSIPQPAGTNFSAYVLSNVGDMDNKGVEFTINATAIRTKKTIWDISFNATYNKNTITNLTVIPNDPNYIGFPSVNISGTQGFAFINSVGTSKNTFFLYHQIYDKSGKPIEGLFEDVNRDGIINEKDKYKGKRADPNVFLGFTTNLSYGKFNAGVTMRSSFNNYVYNNVYSNNGRLNQILPAYALGNASVNYLETNFAGNTEQQLLSDYYLQNASFLRMDNATLGYNAGRIIGGKAGLRLNLSVQNVFVITNYKGLDPEISYGVDNTLYPRPRTVALGINLDF